MFIAEFSQFAAARSSTADEKIDLHLMLARQHFVIFRGAARKCARLFAL